MCNAGGRWGTHDTWGKPCKLCRSGLWSCVAESLRQQWHICTSARSGKCRLLVWKAKQLRIVMSDAVSNTWQTNRRFNCSDKTHLNVELPPFPYFTRSQNEMQWTFFNQYKIRFIPRDQCPLCMWQMPWVYEGDKSLFSSRWLPTS